MEIKKLILENFKKCNFCNSEITNKSILKIENKKIKEQLFVFFTCSFCNNKIYFWKDLLNNKIYFKKKINIVLFEPEIPGNVGTIMRLSCAFDFRLHLIEPFGFIFSKKWLKRSSANHFEQADVIKYFSWEDFISKNKDIDIVLTSAKAEKRINDFDFTIMKKPIFIIFGKESTGLPKNISRNYPEYLFKINQTKLTSSINLGQAVGICTFFILCQYSYLNIY